MPPCSHSLELGHFPSQPSTADISSRKEGHPGQSGGRGRAPSCPPRDKRGRRARHKSHPWDSLQVLLPEPAGITGAPAPQYLQGRTRVVPHTPPLMLVTVSQTLLSLQNQPRGAWLPAWLPLPHLHQPKNQKCPNLTLLGLV